MSRAPRAPGRRRGNVTVIALMVIPLMGFAALAVDLGMLEYAHSQLQVALDAGSLAGVAYLDGTAQGMVDARAAAKRLVAANSVLGKTVQITDAHIVFGVYDPSAETFHASTDPKQANALYLDDDVGNLPTVFAGAAFGRFFLDTQAKSLARFVLRPGAGKIPCYMPIAIPDCYLTGAAIQDYTLRMSSANNDNAGWASVLQSASAAAFSRQFTDNCGSAPATITDTVNLQNGQVNSVVHQVVTMLDTSTQPWDTARWGTEPLPMDGNNPQGSVSTVHPYGNVIEGPVLVFHPRGGTCGAALQFNQSAPIVGVAWGVIYDADDHGAGVNIRMRLDTTWNYTVAGNIGGGVDTNVLYRDLNLVY